MKRPTSKPKGFSLIELLIASGIAVAVVAAASMTFISMNGGLQSLDLTRQANATSRDALLQLEGSLRRLGWGIDPRYAVDMKYQCYSGGKCRDKIDGPDQLAFVARNPMYRWRSQGEPGCTDVNNCFDGNIWRISGVDVPAGTLTLYMKDTDRFERGRVVLAMCTGGEDQVLFTMNANVQGTNANVTIQLNATAALPYHDPAGLKACHGQSGAVLVKIDRFRYFIQKYGETPWLMLDTGVDLDNDGTLPPADDDDLTPIAKNVEDMQVAYIVPSFPSKTAPDSDADWIIGNHKGTAEEPDFSIASPPQYQAKLNDDARYTLHPANVRGVRVTLTIRSTRRDPSQSTTWPGDSVTAAENRNGSLSGGGFRRYVYTTEITTRNQYSKNGFTF